MDRISQIKFDEKGLVPAVVQDVRTKAVLMQAYMNREALVQTIQTKKATYFSRSRQQLWIKGETSGNTQAVKRISYDCDGDCILLEVEQMGIACHTGKYSCFHNLIEQAADFELEEDGNILRELYGVIVDRQANPKEGSYTNYLLEKGVDKIAKKVGEEACEVIIGAKNADKEETVYEIGDLLYHVLVLMVDQKIALEDVFEELKERR
ncbi:MAG: bifunctional phosphoribosyl-AMP cyclohydrolase/phosphoribosyl-ATP diphosphatase HisIE [Christensenellales bacterium]|jgi:phosphoribosyl-ATP pyrophosphohydrolase/phosphoribosyl-AMP cyclohydrolase